MPNAFSVRFVPRVGSFENQGWVRMVYFNEPFNADLFDVTSEYPIIEPEKMAQFPYFKE